MTCGTSLGDLGLTWHPAERPRLVWKGPGLNTQLAAGLAYSLILPSSAFSKRRRTKSQRKADVIYPASFAKRLLSHAQPPWGKEVWGHFQVGGQASFQDPCDASGGGGGGVWASQYSPLVPKGV